VAEVAPGGRERAVAALQLGEDPVAAFLLETVELRGEKGFEVHARHLRPSAALCRSRTTRMGENCQARKPKRLPKGAAHCPRARASARARGCIADLYQASLYQGCVGSP